MSDRQARLGELAYLDASLTPAEREVVRKVERAGMGPREIARRTDRSPGTVGNLLRRARDKLGEGSQ